MFNTTRKVNGSINDDTVVKLSKSVLSAKKPNGMYQNLNADSLGDIRVSIGENSRSSFGELTIAKMTPVIQESFTYNLNTRLINTSLLGSGTSIQADSMAICSSGLDMMSAATLETRKSAKCRPGMGFLCRHTALYTEGIQDTTQYSGPINDDDGFAFGYNGVDFGILHRNNGVDTWIPQTTWNRDQADGLGTLPILDPTKGNIYQIQIQYLGFGSIDFFIENPFDGQMVVVHQLQYANKNTIPSMSNPNLKFKMYVDNGTTTENVVMKVESVGVFIQGINVRSGIINSLNHSKTGITSTQTNILTLKNRETYNSKTNKNVIDPYIINISTMSGTKPVIIRLILNTTLGGTPVFNNLDTLNSIASYDTAGTTVTGGLILTSTILGKEDRIEINLKDFPNIFLDPTDTLTISASTDGGSVDIIASITFLEDL